MSGIKTDMVLTLVKTYLQTEESKRRQDEILDFIEEACERSKTKIDDYTVLPLCKMIRAANDIPEFDS